MPLVHFKSVMSDISAHHSSSVAVEPVSVWKLGLVVLAIWFNKALEVSEGLL